MLAASSIPSRFESTNPYRAAPIWISATEAIDAEGKLRPRSIAPSDETVLKLAFQRYKRSSDECEVVLQLPVDDAPGMDATQSWEELRAKAARGIVVSGEVTEMTVGLYAGIPATLLKVEPRKSNRDLPYFAYVVYPRGAVTIEGRRLCTREPGYADLPKPGDRILFIASEPIDPSGMLFRPPPELIFYQHFGRLVPSPAAERRGLVRFHSLDEIESDLIRQ